jgi:outer membrane receptor protein involved in Fe transport
VTISTDYLGIPDPGRSNNQIEDPIMATGRHRNRSLAAIVCSLLSGAVAAQDTSGAVPDAPVTALEEIVVTAQKRVESLQDVPVAVSAL